MKKIAFTLVLTAVIILSCIGQEQAGQLVLDLQEAVDYSISYNKSLKNARLEVEHSRRSIWEAISQGLPQVDGVLDFMTYFNYELAFSFGVGLQAKVK